MTFDYDGHNHITNFRQSTGQFNIGITRRIFEERDESGAITKRCVEPKRAVGGSTGRRIADDEIRRDVTPGGTEGVMATISAQNPISSPARLTPAIDGILKVVFSRANQVQVSWQIDGFPSFGYSIVRNGVQVMTSVVQDVSCQSVLGVPGAANIFRNLSYRQSEVTRSVDLRASNQTDNRFCATSTRPGTTTSTTTGTGPGAGGTGTGGAGPTTTIRP